MQGVRYNYEMLLRQKLTLSYNIKKTKLTPNISSEYFLPFDEGLRIFVDWVKNQKIERDLYDFSVEELKNKGLIR